MGLEEDAQEELGAIVEECLGSMGEDGTGRSSNASQGDRASDFGNPSS